MKKTILVLPGDGIGPEVIKQTLRVLDVIDTDHAFHITHGLIGGAAYDQYQQHFPTQTEQLCHQADAILFGSVGGPVEQSHHNKWQDCERNSILALRQTLNLAINMRPAKLYPALQDISPLKNQRLAGCEEILIIRELLGDIYFGEHRQYNHNELRFASDLATYNEQQIRKAAEYAFQAARLRNSKVTSVDKANVLATSKLWRTVVSEVALEYPDVLLEHMLVDNCAMQLILNPAQFGVIVTANLFGDILSDAASALPGSLGMMPSASFGANGIGLYEPSGGSAPDIAGQNTANPMAQILSLALLLRHSFAMTAQATQIENAIEHVLKAGFRTVDIYDEGYNLVSCSEFTDQVIHALTL
ncbi:3-isopropylmalate dehydrogenase [Marinicella sp. W31]|uniref:3-isopropylmalate dehydrogenase n=1 Tax=Marinicella sp. W31 TaxID=3023713 RepID=UPI0037564725